MDKAEYWRSKKPCPGCGKKISPRSALCCSCNQRSKMKSDEYKLVVARRASRAFSRRKTHEYKNKIFEKLGACCSRCGFSDKRALHIDHVNDDGCVDRKFWRSTWHKYQQILDDSVGRYQILCANCNFIKRHESLERRSLEKDVIERQTINSRNARSSWVGNVSQYDFPGPNGGQPTGSPVSQRQAPGGFTGSG